MRYVYFVRCGEHGPVKIGHTRNMLDRLGTLQVANHENLKLLCLLEGNRQTEAAFHTQFAKYKIRGEWFRATRTVLAFITALPTELTTQFNTAWQKCCVCGRQAQDHQMENDVFFAYCRRCLMAKDGRLAKLGKHARVPKPTQPCANCRRLTSKLRKGLCGACNEFQRRNGKPRPLTKSICCSNCHKTTTQHSRGRCRTCYSYFMRYDRERSVELLARASAEVSVCSAPAS